MEKKTDAASQLSDEYADVRAPCDGVSGGLGSLMHLKQKHPHLQVILSIGGGGSGQAFANIAASPILCDNLARSARGLVEASGLDGLDIVWQDPQQGSGFLALIAAIRLYLPEEHYLLTAALPCSNSILANMDVRRAADYLDLLNLMTYDFYGAWASMSGHHAQLYSSGKDNDASGSSSVSYLVAQGFPAKKILLGIPVFGRSFLGVAGPGHRFRGVGGNNGEFEYNELPRKGTKEQVDKKACAAYCVGGDGGFVSYDNPETVKQKAAFCRQKGLGASLCSLNPLSTPKPQSPEDEKMRRWADFLHRDCFTGQHQRTPRTRRGVWLPLGFVPCTALDESLFSRTEVLVMGMLFPGRTYL